MASAPFREVTASVELAVRPLACIAPQAWRNGQSTTRTLAEAADGGWRISLADVERDGSYSRFVGMNRVSLVVRGVGVTLNAGSRRIDMRRGCVSAEYDGDAIWQASLLDGPVLKLNAIVARERYTARIVVLREPMHLPSGCLALVLTLHGAMHAACTRSLRNVLAS
ncbi:HutD family protein [Paraburkholderia sp. BR13439]|uniref:HutD family protein n=1 Tax=Paraburkholderia sp. BR13439 TaxID=3236996 RepID=UPI0034D004DE